MNKTQVDLCASYAAALAVKGFARDPLQENALRGLERVRRALHAGQRGASVAARLRSRVLGRNASVPVRGAYLWGGVGRGKTFLMDLFVESLPSGEALRYHFHRLMYRVHGRLTALKQQTDPLDVVARELADQARVICFDEFFVNDIADAMILGNLLNALLRHGVTLIATSNIPPDDLYKGGLQRQRFLPAIDLLRRHTEIIHVDGLTDYRLRVLEQAEIYHSPADDSADRNLGAWFSQIAPDAGNHGQAIEINGRNIPTRRRAGGIVWFDFQALCDGPRSQEDYIEIARAFQTVILSAVPVLDETMENQARRFIALVDEFYDRRVNLIISAAAAVGFLYCGVRLAREFERTRSRLLEMQSHDYLAAPHLA